MTKADIAKVVDYHAFGISFYRLRSVRRFIGVYGGAWQWLPQPSNDLIADIDQRMEQWRKEHHRN
jgi:hypothetical protein